MRASRLGFAPVALAFLASCPQGQKAAPAGDAGGAGPASATGPRAGGFIVLPSPEPRILNPVTRVGFDLATPLLFDSLVALDPKNEPVPVLAQSWDRSADGKTLTFHLRAGVKWHDGQPFGADDVVFTIAAVQSAANSIWSAYLAPVAKVEAPDAQTVVVTYKQPYGPDVASYVFGILPKHLFEGKDLLKAAANVTPVGTGPFKLVRWSPGKDMLLEANPSYWNGRPNLDQVDLRFDVPNQEHLAALRDGRLDFAEITEPADWNGVLRTPEFLDRFETGAGEETTITLITWNTQRKPLDDKRVRVGLTQALDRPRVIEEVLGGAGRPVSGPFYPTMWGADPNIAPWPFDKAAAGKLFDQAGLAAKGGKRFPLELLVEATKRGTVYDAMLAIFRADLADLGVELKVTYLARQDLIDRLILRNFEAVLFEFSADIPDPDPYALLHSSQVNAGQNFAGYVNAEADKLLDAGRAVNDRSKRKEAYFALNKIVHDDAPYTFLYVPTRYYAWNRRLHGVLPLDTATLPRWPGVARWWVSEPAKK
jgi:peptide/nickel transport system substrate-binding protein